MIGDIQSIGNIKPVDKICEACICGKQARLPSAKIDCCLSLIV